MPTALASKDEIIDRLFTVFRERGFEGASLADLSKATGLGRSSLYHYFPEGKEQMAAAVLARAEAGIDMQMFQAAHTPEALNVRVRNVVAALKQMYSDARTPCILAQFVAADISPSARESLKNALRQWIAAIAKLAHDSGMTEACARRFAEDWVARLQGALILRAADQSTKSFERALKALLALAGTSTKRNKQNKG